MNNRTQQRFDRSIREAVQTTQAAQAAGKAVAETERLARHQAQARYLLPAIERILRRKSNGGVPLTRDELKELRARRADYRRLLGMAV